MSDAINPIEPEDAVKAAIEAAEEVGDPAADVPEKPRLLVENASPNVTIAKLRDILAGAGGLYARGVPVRLAFDQTQKGIVAQTMTPDSLVLMAHGVCRPYAIKKGDETNVRLPRAFAVMYLDWRGQWHLPPLNGVASAPLLQDDGTITRVCVQLSKMIAEAK